MHPKYSYREAYQDIAVVKLKENANLTVWVHPICVPEESTDDPNKWERETVDVIGYAYSGFTVNNNLKETEMKVLNSQFCDEKVKEKIELARKGKLAKNNIKIFNFIFLMKKCVRFYH